mmetsp:Transcript_29054/g.40886  ORF Transcript_29054/g.40886 Transcript_29054/m.40886 type:complete len:80 (+) Transcript_29054:717-956(+)
MCKLETLKTIRVFGLFTSSIHYHFTKVSTICVVSFCKKKVPDPEFELEKTLLERNNFAADPPVIASTDRGSKSAKMDLA